MPKSLQQYDLPNVKPAPAKKADHQSFKPGPNPELPDFIRRHATPYDRGTDRYDVPAFNRDIVVDKAYQPKSIYDMHTYWSKKHWAAIREYVRHYLPEKYYPKGTGMVLDCFSGSGMTGVAALMEDRPCVLIDTSPAAAFISYCYTHPVNPEELQDAYGRMMTAPYSLDLCRELREITGDAITNLQQELDWLYETKCDRCGGPATTEYVVYSEQYQCSGCGQVVALYDCQEFRVPKKGRYCPICLNKNRGQPHQDFLVSTRMQKHGAVPVLITYKCLGACRPARDQRNHIDNKKTRKGRYFEEHDLSKLSTIAGCALPHWYPRRRMMDVPVGVKVWGQKWRKGAASFSTVSELFEKRNLWALSALAAAAKRLKPEMTTAVEFTLTAMMLNASRMYRYRISGKGGFQSGNYYIPPLSQVMSARNQFLDKQTDVLKGYIGLSSVCSAPVAPLVTEGSALQLTPFAELVDYIFTDPPYLNVETQYGEMNFVWNAWLNEPARDLKAEISLSPLRGFGWEIAEERFRATCFQIAASLKPGRFVSFCYHDTSERNWQMVQDALLDAGLVIDTVCSLDPKQKSQKQLTKEKIVKSDLVINCRKPNPGQARNQIASSEVELVSRRVREILIETLSRTAGQDRGRLWDTILKRLLTRGQMAEHRFDDILAEIAFRSESGRWFLKEEYEQLSQSDIKNEEEAGAAVERFARLRSTGVAAEFATRITLQKPSLASPDAEDDEIEKYIGTHLIEDLSARKKFKLGARLKGVEFYDCLYFYMTRFLKGRPGGKAPRRNLAEFLEEYLVRFKDGDKWLYRPPDRLEAETLRKSRQTGLGRRIRQYLAFLKGEGDFPKGKMPDVKTLLAWLKYCSTFGLAEEGVLLYEKGGLQLQPGTDDYYDADEYYRNCKRKASKPKDEDDEVDNGEDAEEVEE